MQARTLRLLTHFNIQFWWMLFASVLGVGNESKLHLPCADCR
jgi:hypothetical protein